MQGPIVCQRPGPGELPLGEYPLGDVFSLLGVDNMVKLLTCALLETQVLLYSKGKQTISILSVVHFALIFFVCLIVLKKIIPLVFCYLIYTC